MNKAQLVAAMADKAEMTKKEAEKALAAFEEGRYRRSEERGKKFSW